MSLETAIQNLADAINRLANIHGIHGAVTALKTVAESKTPDSATADPKPETASAGPDPVKRGPGRPRKSAVPEPAPEPPTLAPDTETTPAETAPEAAGAANRSVTREELRAKLIAVVKRHGNARCVALLEPFGVRMLSELDEKHYSALDVAADKALEG